MKISDRIADRLHRQAASETTTTNCCQSKAAVFELAEAETHGTLLTPRLQAVRQHLEECSDCASIYLSALFFANTKSSDNEETLKQLQQAAQARPPGKPGTTGQFSGWIRKLIYDFDLPSTSVLALLDVSTDETLCQADEDSWYVCQQSLRLGLMPKVAAALTRCSLVAARMPLEPAVLARRNAHVNGVSLNIDDWETEAIQFAKQNGLDLTECNQAIHLLTAGL